MVGGRDRDVYVELGLRMNRDGPVEREELVTVCVRVLHVALRPEEADLEVLEHSDSEEDRTALDLVDRGHVLQAREDIFPVCELRHDQSAVRIRSFLLGALHVVTNP